MDFPGFSEHLIAHFNCLLGVLMPTRSTPRQVLRIYEFIKSQQKFHNIKMMCDLCLA
jgi:hypothetical protein